MRSVQSGHHIRPRKNLAVPLVHALRLQFAIFDEKLKELQIADHVYAITPPC
jgi:hypothetical protein